MPKANSTPSTTSMTSSKNKETLSKHIMEENNSPKKQPRNLNKKHKNNRKTLIKDKETLRKP